MNREIKFRDWEPNLKEMRYFDLDGYDRNEHDCYGNIMACVGLFDKNSKEMYEHDIVECDGKRRTIKWRNGKFWFWAEFANTGEDISELFGKYYMKVEIIGNIHEHPHLILS